MRDYGKAVREILDKHGCYFLRRGKGDHDTWYSPVTDRKITVDGKIYVRHTANGVLKQAGISYRFR
ncbi:MAG: type II toxin-antitoxin system HicA family toxin [Oscillospiraceae bacterium]|nr:type II toxin-antitoxin system HicA family toxin [Oscillospiraceae bacterium]